MVLPATHDRVGQHAGAGDAALPRSIGSSTAVGAMTWVASLRRWSFRAYFLYVTATTIVAEGRRSSTSRVSVPISSNAPGSRSTSGGMISICSRRKFYGGGLRTGLARVCSATTCSTISAAGAAALSPHARARGPGSPMTAEHRPAADVRPSGQ